MQTPGSSILWLLLSVTIINSLQCIHCDISNLPGVIIPPYLEVEINSSFNITCIINPSMFHGNVDSSSLYFEQEDTKYVLPSENVHILNATAAVLMLHNVTEQDRYYTCKCGEYGIGMTKVLVGTAPLEVMDFKCRGYDFDYMVCKFTKPHNVLPTKYELFYTAQSEDYRQPCDLEMQPNQGICNLTTDKNNYRYNYELFNFELTGRNGLGKKVQNFLINNFESVIPPVPEYTFENITHNNAVIKWKNPKYAYYAQKGLEYEIGIRTKGSKWRYMLGNELRNNRSEYKILLTFPYPHYRYELSLRLRVKKSAQSNDSYWSEAYIQKFETKACPPNWAPLTGSGSFYIDSTETTVRLYWHQIPRERENGPNFKYIIKEVKVNGVVDVSLKPLSIDRGSATFQWNKNHNYTFVIKSSNAEGESSVNSTIFVPAWSQYNDTSFSPQWIRNVYHAINGSSTLSWSPPHDQKDLINYSVFWCRSKQAIATECDGTIHFQDVSKESTQFHSIAKINNNVLNWAVAANYRNFNTGMHWSMCSADTTSELVKLKPEIIDVRNRSITLQWSTDGVCSSLVEGYNLIYCQIRQYGNDTCMNNLTKLQISNTEKKYTLEKLHPYSSYKIQLNMFSKLAAGNYSDARIAKTLEEAPSKPRTLKCHNVTSNSVILTWRQPLNHNGVLRKYRITYNNEQHTINCETDEQICAPQQIEYKLENLSSYTMYKVYIIAYTREPSASSNDITFETLVGIPSNPRNVKTKDGSQDILQWSRPEVPSGRVEFYEVAITLWHNNEEKQRHISSGIISNECEFHLPICIDSSYRYTKEVRAVNAVLRDIEIDHNLFATKNLTNDDVSEYFPKNENLSCKSTLLGAAEQLQTIKKYNDTQRYLQYKSVWEKGPVTNCSDPQINTRTLIGILIIGGALATIIATYVVHNKYKKMANISCALPPGLEAMAFAINENGGEGDDYRRSKDPFYNNESRRLLSSISQDSGLLYQIGDINHASNNGISTCSLTQADYIGLNHSKKYGSQEGIPASDSFSNNSSVIEHTPIVNDVYTVMDNNNSSSTIQAEHNSRSYIPLTLASISNTKTPIAPPLNTKSTPSLMPTENGYIQPIATQHNSLSGSGYVASQLFQKPLIASSDGYTPLEALGKTVKSGVSTTSEAFVNLDDDGRGNGEGGGGEASLYTNLPAISGYVTQKQMLAFGRQQKFK